MEFGGVDKMLKAAHELRADAMRGEKGRLRFSFLVKAYHME